MDVLYIKVLFFSCIPLGICLLIIGIRRLRKFFNTKILAETRMLAGETVSFELEKPERIAVWIKAPLRKLNYLDRVKITVYNQDKQEYVKLCYKFFQVRFNGFSEGRVKRYFFWAEAGNYKVEIVEGSSLLFIEKLMGNLLKFSPLFFLFLSIKRADVNNCFFQVRENKAPFYGFFSILMTVLGAAGIIVGFILGILADLIWG